MTDTDTPTVSRRSVLKTTAAVGTAAATGTALSGTAAAQSGGLEEWFSDTSNYDGVRDMTGQSEVTVEVGVDANGGAYGYGPAAIRVDPGTTVTWEWVQGSHNVVAEDGSFESELSSETGFTFSQTFEESGVTRYYCTPHQTMGMKGAVVVGDAAAGSGSSGAGGGGGSGGGSGGGGALSTTDVGTLAFAGALVGGLLSPFALKASRSSSRSASNRR